MHLAQILLPVRDPRGRRFDAAAFDRVRSELTERFGGLTAFTRAPAEGLWKGGGGTEADDIAVFEVMTETLDRAWWAGYRRDLEARFAQQAIVVRVQAIELI
ncbi:hypothetical protein [Propylenella binzhouense]|uniref:Uncharacterized protein n=1 Tax=Propylenella binzhouense TaxID=2555902 RepID=A0A964T2Q6_9HYPH|nr:hypothetical protein [Propylenella binzhouense]MYZ47280.1 hypothetical protein [Propylenella binzhouense]